MPNKPLPYIYGYPYVRNPSIKINGVQPSELRGMPDVASSPVHLVMIYPKKTIDKLKRTGVSSPHRHRTPHPRHGDWIKTMATFNATACQAAMDGQLSGYLFEQSAGEREYEAYIDWASELDDTEQAEHFRAFLFATKHATGRVINSRVSSSANAVSATVVFDAWQAFEAWQYECRWLPMREKQA